MTDPYTNDVYRWWHLSAPSPELLAAEADGWLGSGRDAVDIGCGLGAEAAYLAARGWHATGLDVSAAALSRAARQHGGLPVVRADALSLPFRAASFDVALDRGCFHYLAAASWPGYAAQAHRVLRPAGRLLLRACLNSRGVRNHVTEAGIRQAFAGWIIDSVEQAELPSDIRTMPALVIRLRRR